MFEAVVFKITKEKVWLKKEKFNVTKEGLKRDFDTFKIIGTMAYYKEGETTEILPMSRTMNWILKYYQASKKHEVKSLMLLNNLIKRRF